MPPVPTDDPVDKSRFQTSPGTLFLDRFMTLFIKLGGILVVSSVFGIFVFIFIQIFPLFQSATVREVKSIQLPPGQFPILGVDEWGMKPFLVEPDGSMLFVDVETGKIEDIAVNFGDSQPHTVTAASINKREQRLILGTHDGMFTIVSPGYSAVQKDKRQVVTASPKATKFEKIGEPDRPVLAIAYGDSGSQKVVVAMQSSDDANTVAASIYKRKRSLMGAGKEELAGTYDLTPLLTGRPSNILVPGTGEGVIVITEDGTVLFLVPDGDRGFKVIQSFRPFEDLTDAKISVAQFLFGDVTLIFGSDSGENRLFSLFYPEGQSARLFGQIHNFPPLGASPTYLVSTLRNKAFLIGGGDRASLRFSTTETIRWEETLPFTATNAVISGKYQSIFFLDDKNKLHMFELDDPHPDSGWRALFGKLWYEGASEPRWEWQSTGGSDDFEPKYSLVPLIFGTLKGTLYAMVFAVPIALLAAIYTSQFLSPHSRTLIKPTMEIMASLPSVVLGFLAAIYIAPLIETRIPSLLLVTAGLPLAAAIFGWVWSSLPIQIRKYIHPGTEWAFFIPILLLFGGVLWNLGPLFEQIAFVTTDPETGKRVADFRYWWPAATGASFDQRNALVVGFMMGFAVIPIIFTISEDALSNVPASLRTASMSCGASRWQTAIRVVLPTASAGIFSALMIGLGRAVGETMIVVMATGNTPIMEWNIFSGMRTLSANIAVELPEAPHNGTLYRTLFFGALVLFLLTFIVNTVAEILRQHLREKYKTV
jgi:phosphate transport system permease protein